MRTYISPSSTFFLFFFLGGRGEGGSGHILLHREWSTIPMWLCPPSKKEKGHQKKNSQVCTYKSFCPLHFPSILFVWSWMGATHPNKFFKKYIYLMIPLPLQIQLGAPCFWCVGDVPLPPLSCCGCAQSKRKGRWVSRLCQLARVFLPFLLVREAMWWAMWQTTVPFIEPPWLKEDGGCASTPPLFSAQQRGVCGGLPRKSTWLDGNTGYILATGTHPHPWWELHIDGKTFTSQMGSKPTQIREFTDRTSHNWDSWGQSNSETEHFSLRKMGLNIYKLKLGCHSNTLVSMISGWFHVRGCHVGYPTGGCFSCIWNVHQKGPFRHHQVHHFKGIPNLVAPT